MKTLARHTISLAALTFTALLAPTPPTCAQGGVPLCTNRYPGLGSPDNRGNSIVVDGGGNVFVTAYSGSDDSNDYVTLAYSNSGVPLWTNRYSRPGVANSVPKALAVDLSGKVFVTGYSSAISAYDARDYATVAY